MIKTLFAAATLLTALPALAQINIATPATTYSESFDGLLATGATNTWTNNSTVAGWSAFTYTNLPIATYAAGNGSGTTGAIYSFGTDAERALGGLASANTYWGTPGPVAGTVAGYIALALVNGSAVAYDSFTIGFRGEQWRNGGNITAQTMVLEFGFGASFTAVTTWTAPGGNFNWVSPVATATAAIIDGNTTGLVAGKGGTVSTNWAPGSTLWVRWIENNDLSNDHGLAIDNVSFSVTAVPEPTTYALLLAGLGVVLFLARRRG